MTEETGVQITFPRRHNQLVAELQARSRAPQVGKQLVAAPVPAWLSVRVTRSSLAALFSLGDGEVSRGARRAPSPALTRDSGFSRQTCGRGCGRRRGHLGWGRSCFLLRPHICKEILPLRRAPVRKLHGLRQLLLVSSTLTCEHDQLHQ